MFTKFRICTPAIWKFTPLYYRGHLPKQSGLYAIRSFGPWGPIKYIGRSNNLNNRWNNTGRYEHHRLKQGLLLPFATLSYLEIENEGYWETRLIRKFSPPWNGTKPPHKSFLGAIWWGIKRTDWFGVVIIWLVLTAIGYALIETKKIATNNGTFNPNGSYKLGVCRKCPITDTISSWIHSSLFAN